MGFTIDREPGPFCHNCWGALKLHVAQVNLLNHHVDAPDRDVELPAAGSPLALEERFVDETIPLIGERFRTFGGGQDSDFNPIAKALKDEPLQFAAGVDVRAVVEFIVSRLRAGRHA